MLLVKTILQLRHFQSNRYSTQGCQIEKNVKQELRDPDIYWWKQWANKRSNQIGWRQSTKVQLIKQTSQKTPTTKKQYQHGDKWQISSALDFSLLSLQVFPTFSSWDRPPRPPECPPREWSASWACPCLRTLTSSFWNSCPSCPRPQPPARCPSLCRAKCTLQPSSTIGLQQSNCQVT